MTRRDRAWVAIAVCAWVSVALVYAGGGAAWQSREVPDGAGALLVDLATGRTLHESRADLLDTPMLPGSVAKAFALAAALDSGAITPGTTFMCRRVAVSGGQRYVCAHPDVKRPLTPAEALAYSCNDFFVSLTARLSRAALDKVRTAAGLPAVGSRVPYAAAIVGLDGPRVAPRGLLAAVARLAGVGASPPVPLRPATRGIVREGLAGAARYGTAAALGEAGVDALAKTGTAPMPGGGVFGLTVAFAPVAAPRHAVMVVAPGAAGLDASTIAADLLAGRLTRTTAATPRADAGEAAAGLVANAPGTVSAADRSVDRAALVAASGARQVRLGVTGGDGRVRVETLALEDYIARVLAGEGEPGAEGAAQQALAIAARTFAMFNRQRHQKEGFDLCDTTHCQVTRASTAATRQAALATAGRLLLRDGAPANVFYSAQCGGRTALASEVWPGSVDAPEDESREDDACRSEPGWTRELPVEAIERALRASGRRGQRLHSLRVIERTASGRVGRMQIEGFLPGEISGTDFRMAIGRVAGWQAVRSTSFVVERTTRGYRFRGRGFGHGVGLCVVGAGRRAIRGERLETILAFYYPGLVLGRLVDPASRTATPTPAGAARPGGATGADASAATATATVPAAAPAAPAPAGDVRIALPAFEEGERAGLLDLVRRARDDIAQRTGVAAPPTLTVTVHPTAESFARSTRQPWWVAGATEGTSIELLPIATLRLRGMLPRTVWHEVAHALLDPSLAGRALWVREGLPLYFSSGDPSTAVLLPRVQCPTDEEVRQPVSAGAQREAYARAEQCVRRELARGRRWDDIR